MDFMVLLFLALFLGFVGVNIWDLWEEHQSRSLLIENGRFLRRYFARALIGRQETIVSVSPDAKFAIQHLRSAHRCEVCHQVDRFEIHTGFCQRCNHQTL
ncbi:MAG: hypothetical protein AB1489_18045 [Acidobacteriota bacterium]